MSGWKEFTLNEIVDFPPVVKLNRGHEYSFVKMEDISVGQRFVFPEEKKKKYENSSCSKFGNDDILFARITPCLENGKIAQVKLGKSNSGFGSTEFFVFRGKKEKLNQSFLFYLAKSDLIWKSAVNSMVGASGRQRADSGFLGNLKFKIPLPAIQRKIAAVLSAYDDLIENNNRRIAILEKMAEELYREWFVRLRFPGHENVKIVKGVPEGWEVNELSTICFEKRILVKKKNISDSTRYVGLEHITPRSMMIKEHGYATDIQSDKLFFSFGDILFGKIRPYLHKVAISHFDGVCSSDTIIVKVDNKECQAFAYLTISSDSFIDLATTSSTGTKMPRADWDFLKKQRILIPNDGLLKQFQKLFDVYFGAITNYQGRNDLLTTSRDRLLSRLMSGKIAVENLDIQFPASMKEEEVAAHA